MYAEDTLAEWSRRRPAKPMGSPRVGSNPTGVVSWILWFSDLKAQINVSLQRSSQVPCATFAKIKHSSGKLNCDAPAEWRSG